MARTRRLLPHERFAIARDYEKGVSAKALAARFGVSTRTVNYTVKAETSAKIDNGSRTEIVNVRMSKAEVDAFDAVLQKHGIDRRVDGMRALIHAASGLFVTDAELKDDLHGYRIALNRIGNNVSQIAKRMNEANLKGFRPPFDRNDLATVRSLAGMVLSFGDQLQGIIQQRRNGLAVRVSDALKGFADGPQ